MTISKQATIGFMAIVLFAIITIVATILVRHQSAINSENAKTLNQIAQTTLLPLERQARIAQFDVIQVQQFLSDASATHHHDSFDAAETYAKDFHIRAAAIRTALTSSDGPVAFGEHLGKLKDAIEICDKLFPDYNKLGIEMAGTYIDKGVDAGNELMKLFDPMSDKINDTLQVLVDGATLAYDSGATLLAKRMDRVDSVINAGDSWILIVNILLLGATLVIAVQLVIFSLPHLTAMTETMRRLASHRDLTTEIPGAGRRDEIGAMAAAVTVFRDSMMETERLTTEQRRNQEVRLARAQTVEQAVGAFDHQIGGIVNAVASAVTKMTTSATSLTMISDAASKQSAAGASASQEVSVSIHTIASATEELSSSITEISRQITLSSRIASKAAEDAKRTDATVQGLADAAHKIGDVIGLINEIASQTNLLALNATIEAARAGEAGKGFAVVASEVKHLASQTAKATEDITAQIAAIQSSTAAAVTAIQGVGGTISEINHITATIASAVEEQGAATQEISRNIQQAASGSDQLARTISQVTEAAETTHSASSDVQKVADSLVRQGELLRAGVNQFLAQVRAA